jgi:hypothetical protein
VRVRLSLGAVVLALGAGVLAPTPAAAACAGRTARSISGTVYGVDNRDVNVSLGFDVESTTGQIINVSDGCAKTGGYSAPVIELNHYVGGEGAPRSSRMYDAKGQFRGYTSRTWKLSNLPANAKYVWIEAYARRYNGSPCTTCMGPADTHKYGYSMRRRVPVGATNQMVRLPISCGFAAGSAGSIAGSVKDRAGRAVQPDKLYAWSLAPDSNYSVLGWGSASVSNGSYRVATLASGQSYVLWLYKNGRVHKRTNVRVDACRTTTLNWVI